MSFLGGKNNTFRYIISIETNFVFMYDIIQRRSCKTGFLDTV